MARFGDNASVVEEADEGGPSVETVIDRLGVSLFNEERALLSQPCLIGHDQRLRSFLANGLAFIWRFSIDGALDFEQLVDTTHGFDRDRCLGGLRQFEELAARVSPTGRLVNRPRLSLGVIKFVVSCKGVRPHHPRPAREMFARIFAMTRRPITASNSPMQ